MTEATIFRLSIAIDEHGRSTVQTGLDALAATNVVDGSDADRAAALRSTLALLGSVAEHVTHSFGESEVHDEDTAPEVFDAKAKELRGRYPHETRRNETTAPPPELPASDAEGFVVVSLVTGWAANLEVPSAFVRRTFLQTFLKDKPPPVPLVALEVIWSPSVDGDRMNAEAMAEKYPELQALTDD